MPFYEYRCRKCNHQFELMQKMEEQGRAHCPECGSGEVEKLLSVFGVAASTPGETPGCGPQNCGCGRYGGK
jgi:putative FmdB family regulatory protein